MLKRLRIAFLLYVLLFVAMAEFLAARRSTDWDSTLWVDVYLVAGDESPATREHLQRVERDEFAGLERFFAEQARSHGIELAAPFKISVVAGPVDALPRLPADAGALATLWWSLRMRWTATRLQWRNPGPDADIVAFAVYHDAATGMALDRSVALRKGLIAVANVFAAADARGANNVVLAHELLHTLGASDKYDPATNLPRFPHGFAAPESTPLLPQSKAELMAGRIPLSEREAAVPESLEQVIVGEVTAAEIGWRRL
jgi:hypothetical protein